MSLLTRFIRPVSLASSSRIPLAFTPLIASATFTSSAICADKLKSHSGTKKRFFKTGSGLYKRGQAGKRHLNTMFSATRINRLGRTAYASLTQAKKIRKLIPHA